MNEDSPDKTAGGPPGDKIVRFMRETAPRPLSESSLAKELNVADDELGALRATLESLLAEGRLVRTRDDRYGVPEKMNLVVGDLSCHADGYGFVIPRGDPDQPDLFVSGKKLGNAMHGDLVVARKEHVRRSGKIEGRVIRVLNRARTQVVGKFERSRNFGFVNPLDERMVYDVYIAEEQMNGAEEGKVVCAEITDYPEGSRNPEGRILEILGDADDPKIDVDIIIREHELPHTFPDDVLAAAEKIPTEVTDEDLEGREDFRQLPIVTIDGETAKDFDDAVHVEKLRSGNFRLSVHIADVSAYLPVGSAIDLEARRRATSVYFPDRVVPMLPERLSNEICSLKPGVDRLVQSVVMEIDHAGKTVNYEFHDGVIRSAARMTYSQVASLLEGDDDQLTRQFSEHVDHFRRMSELCNVLRRYRGKRGALDFDLPEPEVLIDVMSGKVEQILRADRNEAHRIIEEFMIRTNEVVASQMTWENVPCLYRVHAGPDPEKVERFREFLAGLGLRLGGGDEPRPHHFQSLIEHLEGQPGERVVTYQMLRAMKQAVYQPENVGHFGLASSRYTHFTSPIRRYPDLLAHRLLKADRGSPTQEPFDVEAMEGRLGSMGQDCSRLERNAEHAERQYIDWKRVQFMADKVGDEFDAFIISVHSFGFFVELEPYFVEGLVHVSSLDDDYYEYEEDKHRLRGRSTGRTFKLGNRVRVQLARVDRERRRLDFSLLEGPLEAEIEVPKDQQARADERDGGGGKKTRRRSRRGRSRGKGDAKKNQGRGGDDDKGRRQQAQKERDEQEQRTKGSGRRGSGRRRRGSEKSRRDEGRQQKAGGGGKKEENKQGGRGRQARAQEEKKDEEGKKPDAEQVAVNPYLTKL